MNYRLFIQTALVVISFISITSAAMAGTAPWTSQTYTAYSAAGESLLPGCIGGDMCDIDESSGATIPVSASASYFYPGYPNSASSEITASTMYTEAMVTGIQVVRAYASADYTGNYVSDDNFFVFSYDGELDHLTVNNVTTSTILLDISTTGSSTYYIPTAVGNEIEVSFGTSIGEITRSSQSGSSSLTYNMSTAVAPEPISSILFITGGTLLAGRRYIKRKHESV